MVIEFQTTFNSTFWELYLFNVLKKWNINIDFSKNRPDFYCNNFNGFNIEAVIANNALNDTPEWKADFSMIKNPNLIAELINKATLRLANSISSKYSKLRKDYCKLDHVKNKPFIIAVAPFEQPFFWEQSQSAIFQVLYGIKGYQSQIDESTNTRKILGVDYIDYIEKENGSQIDLGFFSNEYTPEISAVIFNNCATFGKLRALTKNLDKRDMIFLFSRFNKNGLHPFEGALNKNEYHEEIEDGICIYLNPYASYPVPEEFISLFPSVYFYDCKSKFLLSDCIDNVLFKRMVTILNLIE